MSKAVNWSTIISTTCLDFAKMPNKQDLIDLFIEHAPEVCRDIKLLGKLCIVLQDNPFQVTDKVSAIFSKFINFGPNCFINLKETDLKLNPADLEGETPLTFALRYCNLNTVQQLLETEDINKCNSALDTPLLAAIRSNRLDAIPLILNKKNDRRLIDEEGRIALRLVFESKDLNLLKLLLTKDNINLPVTDDGYTPLWHAVKINRLEFIEHIIEKGGDVNIRNLSGMTLLMFASSQKHKSGVGAINNSCEIIKLLIEHNAPLQDQDSKGCTALHYACSGGCFECVNLLFREDSLNLLTARGQTLLITATSGNHPEIVDYLVKKGANLDQADLQGYTAFHYACSLGHMEVLKQVLIDVNKATTNGLTPLILASGKGHIEVVRYLIELGAQQDLKQNLGKTALHGACANGRLDVVKELLKSNAETKINITDNNGMTPLMEAVCKNQLEVVRYLISQGADQKLEEKENGTAFHLACTHGSLELLQLFLTANDDVNKANLRVARGYTPLMFACLSNKNIDVVRYLIDRGADPKRRNNVGETALHIACIKGNLEAVKLLLAHNKTGEINLPNMLRTTPLMMACFHKKLEVVKYLLAQKADTTAKDSFGKTAIDLAIEVDSPEIIELFLDELNPLLKSSVGIIDKIRAILPFLKYKNPKKLEGFSSILERIMSEFYTKKEWQSCADLLCSEIKAVRPRFSKLIPSLELMKKFQDFQDIILPFFSYFYKKIPENISGKFKQISDLYTQMCARFRSREEYRNEFKENGLDNIFSDLKSENQLGCNERQSLEETYLELLEVDRQQLLGTWKELIGELNLDNEVEVVIATGGSKDELFPILDRKIKQDPIAAGRLALLREDLLRHGIISSISKDLVEAEQYFNIAILKYHLQKSKNNNPAKRKKA